ncbi:MAG: polysaccharide pyruvyl transferase CsaB [Spirulina sp. SIO3F2]|nr:polysaccharide pyruvyl transferase CsaB [Spirulina sp. SIO3F2]
MAPKAILCGYYGQGNGGDEALLATLLQMLPSNWQPLVLSGDPHQTYQQYHVQAYDRRSAPQLLTAFGTADAFIWGGGSLMQDATSWASPLYYGGLMGLAQQRDLKTVAWAQGIGPLNRALTRWLTHQALRGTQAITVRDPASATLVEQWQLPHQLAPDPVWALTSLPWEGEPFPANAVAVNLRPHRDLTPDRLTTLTQALQQFQQKTDSDLVLVPFQASQDLAIAEQIASQLLGPNQVIMETDPRKLKGIFAQMTFMIGMRLHSLIMAASEGCPCFALSYDPKVTQLMAIADLPGYELAQLPTDAGAIADAWAETMARSDKQATQHKATQFAQQARLHQEVLHAVLNCNVE